MATTDEQNESSADGHGLRLWRRHTMIGWWSLLAYSSLGLLLEVLHGWKVGWYLDVGTEARRLMWTLSHAHGTLLSLVNLAFASATIRLHAWTRARKAAASACLVGATLLMPLGFFLGGLNVYGGDPGLGSLLVAPGAALLLCSLLMTAMAATGSVGSSPAPDTRTNQENTKRRRKT